MSGELNEKIKRMLEKIEPILNAGKGKRHCYDCIFWEGRSIFCSKGKGLCDACSPVCEEFKYELGDEYVQKQINAILKFEKQLKACPFCGSEVFVEIDSSYVYTKHCYIRCYGCETVMRGYEGLRNLVKKWNTRS